MVSNDRLRHLAYVPLFSVAQTHRQLCTYHIWDATYVAIFQLPLARTFYRRQNYGCYTSPLSILSISMVISCVSAPCYPKLNHVRFYSRKRALWPIKGCWISVSLGFFAGTVSSHCWNNQFVEANSVLSEYTQAFYSHVHSRYVVPPFFHALFNGRLPSSSKTWSLDLMLCAYWYNVRMLLLRAYFLQLRRKSVEGSCGMWRECAKPRSLTRMSPIFPLTAK